MSNERGNEMGRLFDDSVLLSSIPGLRRVLEELSSIQDDEQLGVGGAAASVRGPGSPSAAAHNDQLHSAGGGAATSGQSNSPAPSGAAASAQAHSAGGGAAASGQGGCPAPNGAAASAQAHSVGGGGNSVASAAQSQVSVGGAPVAPDPAAAQLGHGRRSRGRRSRGQDAGPLVNGHPPQAALGGSVLRRGNRERRARFMNLNDEAMFAELAAAVHLVQEQDRRRAAEDEVDQSTNSSNSADSRQALGVRAWRLIGRLDQGTAAEDVATLHGLSAQDIEMEALAAGSSSERGAAHLLAGLVMRRSVLNVRHWPQSGLHWLQRRRLCGRRWLHGHRLT